MATLVEYLPVLGLNPRQLSFCRELAQATKKQSAVEDILIVGRKALEATQVDDDIATAELQLLQKQFLSILASSLFILLNENSDVMSQEERKILLDKIMNLFPELDYELIFRDMRAKMRQQIKQNRHPF